MARAAFTGRGEHFTDILRRCQEMLRVCRAWVDRWMDGWMDDIFVRVRMRASWCVWDVRPDKGSAARPSKLSPRS